MKLRRIESIEHWEMAEKYFKDNGYNVWQFQYGWNHPEGAHSWFNSSIPGNDQIEIITHNKDVHKAIVGFDG